MALTDRALLFALGRTNFFVFLQKTFGIVNPGKALHENWHLHAMAYLLETMAASGRSREIITMPPRSLKSITVSVAWPAFLLGLNPAEQIIVASYNEKLAVKLSNDTRKLIESEFYKSLFPRTRLAKSTELQLETDQGGTRFATSVGAAGTGFGANWLIVDDPHNASEIHSESARTAVKAWFDGTLRTRLDDPTAGKIILVMQRLHDDDLAGHLLSRGGWGQLKLQACATEDAVIEIGKNMQQRLIAGDLLHPRRLPQAVIDELVRDMGSANFQAQFQQEPIPAEGAMIKQAWLRYYDVAPPREDDQVILSLDTATKTNPSNDFSVCTVWLRKAQKHYLLDVWRDKVDFPGLRNKVSELWRRHRADRLLIEDQAAGTSLIQELNHLGIPAIARKAQGTKESRLSAASSYIESENVLLPKDAPWLATFVTELLGFPGAKHDDQVDSLSQYIGWVRERQEGRFDFDMMRDDPIDHDALADRLLWARGR
jgi:predicted phage terminase large subunit-like protein